MADGCFPSAVGILGECTKTEHLLFGIARMGWLTAS